MGRAKGPRPTVRGARSDAVGGTRDGRAGAFLHAGGFVGGEPFEDANGNGQWDADRGRSGFGGARDAVLYSVNVEYDRFFPIARFIGVSETMDMTVSTVLRNQPYGLQDSGAPAVGNCP